MLRIVLPRVVSLTAIDVVSIQIVLIEIIVPIIIVIVINVDVAVAPIAIAPMATPRSPGSGAERNPCAPHQSGPWHISGVGVVVIRIVSRRSSVNDCRIVRGHVNYVRVRLLNLNHLLAGPGCTATDCLGLHNLLRAGF